MSKNKKKENNENNEKKVYNRKIARKILKRMYHTNKINNWWKRLQGYPIRYELY